MIIPKFNTKQELFKFLKENKSLLIDAKKAAIKYADAISFEVPVMDNKGVVIKDLATVQKSGVIQAELVINTTNLLDSHGDVHISGLWKKSLQETKGMYLLREHKMQFDSVITDRVVPSAKTYTWKDLGFKFEGSTEALVFNATIDNQRNPFMFDQYTKGYVKEHSVGMRYVKIDLAINSESKHDAEEKAVWDKYYSVIANKDAADELGYFFAVTEAKAIEGSAVLKGSNYATPTISITEADTITSEKQEPSIKTLDVSKMIKEFKIN